MPLVYNWQLFKGCLRAPLRAFRGDYNNIFYIISPLFIIGPQSPLLCGRGRLLRALLKRGPERYRYTNIYNLSI